jgi:endoglucanase
VVEKKARLGVDSWGSVDSGIRHVMEPIEHIFADEFPDFEPYPWGRQRWIQRLVRNILLAEPLVGDFGRCFEGHTPGEAEAIVDSFAFERCAVREPFAEILGAVSRS